MHFQVLTIFPEMIDQATSYGVLGQARKAEKVRIETLNPRVFTTDFHKTVDDRPFGGGDGMVMLAEPLAEAVQTLKKQTPTAKVIYLSPHGERLSDAKVRSLSQEKNLILVCGRYGGIDQRFLNSFVDEEISIGDYVLSGGELAALVVMDSVSRHLPGVLGNACSSVEESFAKGLLEYPQFSRPREWREQVVPDILMSGHHGQIATWRESMSILRTWKLRPELCADLSGEQIKKAVQLFESMAQEEQAVCGLLDLDVSGLKQRLL